MSTMQGNDFSIFDEFKGQLEAVIVAHERVSELRLRELAGENVARDLNEAIRDLAAAQAAVKSHQVDECSKYPPAGNLRQAIVARESWLEALRKEQIKIAKGEEFDRDEVKRLERGYEAWCDEVNDLHKRQLGGSMENFGIQQDDFHASGRPLRGQLEFPGLERDFSQQASPHPVDELTGVIKELLLDNVKLRSEVRSMRFELEGFREHVSKEISSAVLSVRSESTDAVGTG